MIHVSKTKTVYQDREALRKRESTLFHISRGWLPLQHGTLSSIQESYVTGEFSADSEKLVSVIKQDLSLYSRLACKIKPSEESENSTVDPITDLKKLSSDEIVALLPSSSSQFSKHRIEKGTPSQKACLASSLLSSTASETFAVQSRVSGNEISPDEVTSASLMRQLGFNLLAWNYSTLFFKLVRSYRNNPNELDRALQKHFGFTPLSIAQEYAKNWNLSLNLRSSLQETGPYQSESPVKEICELGDIFGKTSQPSLFPSAKREWEEKTDRLKDLIGTDNTVEIREQIESSVEERLKTLLRTEPNKFNSTFSMLRPTIPSTSVYLSSPIFKQLPEEIKEAYKPIYEQLLENEARLSILKELTQIVIPSSGFLAGAIYLQSDNSDELKVKIEIGKTVKNRMSASSFDLTAGEALGSNVPLLNKEALGTRISSSFTSPSHSGVLVLELDKDLEDSSERNNILLFKAARECLVTCLG